MDFHPASPSIITVVCVCKLSCICQDVDSSTQSLSFLLTSDNPDSKSIRRAIQRPGGSIVLQFAAAHCVITFSDKAASTTTAMLSCVINAEDDEQEQREHFVEIRFGTGDRGVGSHGN